MKEKNDTGGIGNLRSLPEKIKKYSILSLLLTAH